MSARTSLERTSCRLRRAWNNRSPAVADMSEKSHGVGCFAQPVERREYGRRANVPVGEYCHHAAIEQAFPGAIQRPLLGQVSRANPLLCRSGGWDHA